MTENKPVGLTKDVGWEMGIRRTFPVSFDEAWQFLFSQKGIAIWLGKLKPSDLEVGKAYKTADGIEGVIRVFKPQSHIRLSWKKRSWHNNSTLQVRVLPAKDKATISFHQDKLLNKKQREEMLAYWEKVLEKIGEHL